MKNIILLLFLLLCCNCIYKQSTSIPPKNDLFCQAFIDNVEYFRLFKDYSGCHKDSIEIEHPNSQWDPANFFEPYASRYSLAKDNYINSPLPTQKQITITVDTIIYNTDSLFCVAFICIYSHYDIIKGVENACRIGREYDAKSVIGFRENINEPLDIYPLNTFSAVGYQDCKSAISILKDLYFNELKGSSLPFLFESGEYEHNLNDSIIFNSILFKKNIKYPEFYNFQLYRYNGKIKTFNYYSNQSDSIKIKWIQSQ